MHSVHEPSAASRRALRATELLDTPPEVAFDRLTRLAAGLLHAPLALVSLVDEARQFFKSAFGLAEPWATRREIPLSHSFCAHVTRLNAPLVVDDARVHPLVRDNRAVPELGVLAYAGVPLVVRGQAIGALCVADGQPRTWTDADVALLRDLADSVVSEIELRVATKDLHEQQALTEALIEGFGDGVLALDSDGEVIVANAMVQSWFRGVEVGGRISADWTARFGSTLPDGRPLSASDGVLARAMRGESTTNLTFTVKSDDVVAPVWLEGTGRPVRNKEGRIVAGVGVFRDVTSRFQSAERNDQSLAAILDSVAEGLIVTDRDQRIQRMNPVAETLTGWRSAEAIGRSLAEVFAPGDDGMLRARTGGEHAVVISMAPIIEAPALSSGSVVAFRDMTAERAALAALAASEAKYRELYENAPDMYMTVDATTSIILDCNRTLYETLGYAKDELVGQPFYAIYHHEYLAQRSAIDALARATGELTDVERRLRTKDGGALAASLNLRGLRDEQGNLVRWLGVWRDISRRTQAELDRGLLLALTNRLHSTTQADVFEVACGLLRAHLGVTACVFATATNIAPLRPSSTPIAIDDVTTEDDADAFLARGMRAVVAAPQLREGTWVASLVVSSDVPRTWEEREVQLIQLVAERVWLWSEHLRLAAERFRDLVEGIRDYAIFMLDRDGRVATWNAGAERIKQYTSAEILGEPYERFFPAADVAAGRPAELLARAVKDGRHAEEGLRLRKDGSSFWAETLITALYASDGSLEGYAKVARDVTERKRRDEELARAHREREVLLQEVHHRVKNNLQIISSLMNMQARKLEAGPGRTALEQCRSRVLTIALIHQNLYQSKDYGNVRFADYVRTLASNVLRATGLSSDDVALDLDIDDVPLSIDRALPCALIVNELITNAVKHAFVPGTRGHLQVQLRAEGDSIRLTVSDDGRGVPADFDVSTSSSLGMKLVVTLARQLDAELTVRAGRGASFGVAFPARS